MIDEIQVSNLALIEQASIEFSEGLTVITGETGAGKSALLSALSLLMGARADKAYVREGSSQLAVAGRFFNISTLEFADGSLEGKNTPNTQDASDELIVTRSVSADGRSKVALNGMMASVGELAGKIAPSIDLCSQHEHQKLMRPVNHGRLLDMWGDAQIGNAKAAYEQAFDEYQDALEQLNTVLEAAQSSMTQLDNARLVLKRIDAVAPAEGEYEQLLADFSCAEHAETLMRCAQIAHDSLSEEGGVLDSLSEAIAALDEASRIDERLEASVQVLREASFSIEDAAREVRDYRSLVDFDEQELERLQQRIASMQGLLKAYGPRMQDVFDARRQALALVEAVDDKDFLCEKLKRILDEKKTALTDAAGELAACRSLVVPLFEQQVNAYMQRLQMGSASLECAVSNLEFESWTRAGSQTIEFLFRPGADMGARPLQRIASGGEVSRVMLSIKAALGQADDVDTLVFDEIDAGVGGSAARALAEVLADLAKTHQVIVVTHLAQVAVYGARHYVVSKTNEAMPKTVLEEISDALRIDEIARMLSGELTDASRAHAQELISQARGQ